MHVYANPTASQVLHKGNGEGGLGLNAKSFFVKVQSNRRIFCCYLYVVSWDEAGSLMSDI